MPKLPFISQPDSATRRQALPGIAAILVLAALWLCLARYHGFFHDALLYTTMALEKLTPANFHNDLLFRFGSQGEFSVFPALFAGLIKTLGLDQAAFLYTACGEILWLAGLVTLARRVNTGWGVVAGIACVVFFSRYYDAGGNFSYAEPFPTPRIFAEALSLFALAAVLGRRYLATVLLLLAAIAFHPLMAAYALLIANLVFLLDSQIRLRVRVGYAVLGILALTALVVARVSVFAGFLQPFDDLWYAILVIGKQDVLPAAWDMGSIYRILFLMLVLVLAQWQLRRKPLETWIFIGSAAFLLVLWGIGSGPLRDMLVTQLQPWRCAWLLQVLALLSLGQLLTHLWPGTLAQRGLAALLTTALLQSGFSHTSGAFALSLAVAGAACFLLLRRIPAEKIEHTPWRLLPLLIPAPQLLANTAAAWNIRWASPGALDSHDWRAAAVWMLCALTLLGIGIATRRLQRTNTGSSTLARSMLASACLCLLGGAWVWSTPYLDSLGSSGNQQATLIHKLQAKISTDAVVYAEPGLRWTWFALNRSYYADTVQLSGVVFSRNMGIEGLRRLKTLCNIGVPGCPTDDFQADFGADHNAFWQTRIRLLCEDTALDDLVLFGRIEGGATLDDGAGNLLSVISCATLRRASPDATK